MDRVTLGRTNLQATVMGLGCGGHSRLGLSYGKTTDEAVQVVHAALDLGVNFIDTAEGYGTEEVVGIAAEQWGRDRILISTKAGVRWKDEPCSPHDMRERVDACLKRLRTDTIDLFHLHGVNIEQYDYALNVLAPVLLELKAAGKIRFVGMTEQFGAEPSHKTLIRAVNDDCWDVMMVGFNILNQSARDSVLAKTQEKNIGALCMFAVRKALSNPDTLCEVIKKLVELGLIDGDGLDRAAPLNFLERPEVALSIQDAAYRFCRWEPGIDVVLSGTGNIAHLRANAESISRPPLPEPVQQRLRTLFARVDSISGN